MPGFFCIELKSRYNHPTSDELYHLNLDDSVSDRKVEFVYNPNLAMYLIKLTWKVECFVQPKSE